jgi:uncharacterized RmlC-like cupin family protein
MSECTIIRPGGSFSGRQGLEYAVGVSAESAGARAICMHRLTLPPGARAHAHLHEDHESSIYVISGRADFWFRRTPAASPSRRCSRAATPTSRRAS